MNHRRRMFVGLALVVFCLSASSFAQMPGMGNGSGSFSGYQGHQINNDLIVPQVVVGQHYTTNLLLLNMGNSQMMSWVPIQNLTTTGKVYFYRQDGTGMPISVNGGAPASEFSFSLDPSKAAYYVLSSSGSDTPGWALIDVDEPASGSGWGMMNGQTITRGMRIMADIFYAYSGNGQPTSRVGVIPTMYEMGQFATSIIGVQSEDDLYTGVAVVNTNATAVTVTLRLRDSNGTILATSPLTLNPGNQTARFVHQLFASVLPANFHGFLEVSSSGDGVVIMGLLVSQGIMTSVPMVHYGQITMMP